MCAMMQKLRVNSMAMKAALSKCAAMRSILPPLSFRTKSSNVELDSKSICYVGDSQRFQIGHLTPMRSPLVFTGRLGATAAVAPSKHVVSIQRRLLKSAERQRLD